MVSMAAERCGTSRTTGAGGAWMGGSGSLGARRDDAEGYFWAGVPAGAVFLTGIRSGLSWCEATWSFEPLCASFFSSLSLIVLLVRTSVEA
jgi:hypothetical protein